MKQYDVLGFGAVAVDDLLYVDAYPAPDSKTPVRERRREGGGLAGTALVAAARLGAEAAWCGVMGYDELSCFTMDALSGEEVDCSHVVSEATARPHYSIIVVDRSTGSRTLLTSNEGVTPFPPENVTEELISSARVLFVDHHVSHSVIKAVRLARQNGIPVVADIERFPEGIEELLPLVDHLICSEHAARQLTGEDEPEKIARKLAEGRACGAVTLGENGCWWSENGGDANSLPAFKVHVVDTTGCGDVFHGAYAAHLAFGESIENAMRIAAACAALKATQPGGRAGIPNQEQLKQFLASLQHPW
jgi:ribokinase